MQMKSSCRNVGKCKRPSWRLHQDLQQFGYRFRKKYFEMWMLQGSPQGFSCLDRYPERGPSSLGMSKSRTPAGHHHLKDGRLEDGGQVYPTFFNPTGNKASQLPLFVILTEEKEGKRNKR
ncbi:uncharacterized protein [Aristolochia californica]|uniref:uncharacterized protein n=1 Tax=Aristolochia californica TaxID=171875 RepID=UPI0035D703E8